MSLDDTVQAKNTSRWRNVQTDFENIYNSVNSLKDEENQEFITLFREVLENEVKEEIKSYKITFLNGISSGDKYSFTNYKLTLANSVMAYKLYDKPINNVYGLLMYDVNGTSGPNKWGKDVFGFNILSDKFEPFCKNDSINEQRQDCSKNGTGLCCSNYYLMGGSFD